MRRNFTTWEGVDVEGNKDCIECEEKKNMNSSNETNAPPEEENFAFAKFCYALKEEGGEKNSHHPFLHLRKADVLTIHRSGKSVGNDSRNNWKEIYRSMIFQIFHICFPFFRSTPRFNARAVL